MSKPDNTPHLTVDENGREILSYPNGMQKFKTTGYILKPPTESPITRDPAGMGRLSHHKKELARVRGIIRGTGLPMPKDDDIEAMADAEASAVEVLTAVMANAFMNSQNLRGMAETWGKLTGTKDEAENTVTLDKSDLLRALAEFAGRIPEAIEGKVIDE